MIAAPGAPTRKRDFRQLATYFLLPVLCCVAMALGASIWSAPRSIDVVVRAATTTSGNGQIFPLTDNGYTEQRATIFPMAHDGLPHEYAAQLAGLVLPGAFRLDPGVGKGRVTIQWIVIQSGQNAIRLDGQALREAVRPLNHLSPDNDAGGLSFRSEGGDPYLQVAIPPEVLERDATRRYLGLLLALAAAAALLAVIWRHRYRLWAEVNADKRRKAAALFATTVVAALILLGALQTGCDGACSWDGVRYGSALLLAAVALGLVGAASLQLLGLGPVHARTRIFIWIAVGQLALVVYVFLRSAVHAALPLLPLSAYELAAVVAAASIYLWSSRPRRSYRLPSLRLAWLGIEAALLVTVCLVVADRELPRLVMLSSDPDTHAYLARQLELRGAIPWQGEAAFGYPAGTAALGFIWAKLSLLDVRNSVTALPLLQSFIAALVLGEALALRTRAPAVRLIVMLTTLGVTAAGFLIPLYVNYSHMEGAGRQMAIASAAIVPALLLHGPPYHRGRDRRLAGLVLASLFVLAVLNPISVVVPIILAVAWSLYRAFAGRGTIWWPLAMLALPILLLLDPYYFQLIAGPGPTGSKITITETMQVKSIHDVLAAWLDHHLAHPLRFLRESLAMGPGQAASLFAALLAAIVALRLALKQAVRVDRPALFAIALALLALVAADGLFAALGDDRRFYLLAPYYAFTLGQLKILLVTTMAGGVILLARARGLGIPTLAVPGVLLILLVRVGMHDTQRYTLEPRADYCGSLGCATPDDIEVMTRFAEMTRQARDGATTSLPRVLVPNSVHYTRNEDWVFPVAGARALPFYDVPPVAFFYYQGDEDYTTRAYEEHVCRHFDRDWLEAQGVRYVFLPSSRGAACLDGMEQLPMTEEVLIRSGNSYLLRLR